MPLVEELATWKCVYCDSINEYTDWRCYNCHKKKPKWKTVKGILSRRKKAEDVKQLQEKQEKIEKIDNLPEANDNRELQYDTSKISTNTD
jgi:hypothetical protein